MQSLRIDILDTKVLKLLQDLETLQLIRLHNNQGDNNTIDWSAKYKGAMTKQTSQEIDNQLNELREGGE